MSWEKHRILVTGASGFIGGRVCERLFQAGAHRVRALVHTPEHAVRISRLPIELHIGDLLDRRSLRRALDGVRIVLHLGLGYGPGIVRGTRNLLREASTAGIDRFVHISTTGVYGLKPPPGCETEAAAPRRTGNIYCDNKLRAEEAVLQFGRKEIPIVILRPSIVYGPYSRWCTQLATRLRQGDVVLIDDGRGICNTTYVDNLVDAVFLALENERAIGEVFTITDGEAVTWGQFIRAHAEMLEPTPVLPNVSSEKILTHYKAQPGLWAGSVQGFRKIMVSREFREMMKQIPVFQRIIQRLWYSVQDLDEERKERLRLRLSGAPDVPPARANGLPIPDLDTWALQTGTVFYQIEKARRLLGYKPRIPFAQGIRFAEQWLRFANYL